MGGWTTNTASSNDWIVDETSVNRKYGGGIDWASVGTAYATAGVIKSGTAVAQLANGLYVPRVDIADANGTALGTETASGLLVGNAHSADSAEKSDALNGYGIVVGGIVNETLLPDSGDAEWATIKTELAASGSGFVYETYANDAS